MVTEASHIVDIPMAETARPSRRYLRHDRVALDAEKARARDDLILGIAPHTLIAIFVISMVIPAEFPVGPIRLTPYLAVLLVFSLPLFLRLLRQIGDKTNRLVLLDLFFTLYVLTTAIGIVYTNGLSRIVFAVSTTITYLGAYMAGRVLIRRTEDYDAFFRVFFYALVFWLPFAVIELVTKRMIISEILAHFADPLPRAGNEPRLGLNRVQAFMEHAITYGLLCSLGVVNSFYILRDAPMLWRLARTGFFAFMTFISLSSAPNIGQGLQFLFIGWDQVLKGARHKWVLLVILVSVPLLMIQFGTPKGIIGFVIDNLAFDPSTGWGRTLIFQYGWAEAMRHPWFGMGLNADWTRPFWMKPSVDNFWLLMAMRYGLPAAGLLIGSVLLHLFIIVTRTGLSEKLADYRKAYVITWLATIFILWTVHIWGSGPVFIMAYLGAGVMFYAGPDAPTPPGFRRRQAIAEEAEARRSGAPDRRGAPRPPESGSPESRPRPPAAATAARAVPPSQMPMPSPAPSAPPPSRPMTGRPAGARGAPAPARRAPFPSE